MEKINYKKGLGQNFLYDTNLLKAIATDGEVQKDDTVLEIGAGAGTLTAVLAEMSKQVISFEIDKSLEPILNEVKQRHKNIEFRFCDFLDVDIDSLDLSESTRVIANIPYYITTPIIFKLIEHIDKFRLILVLIQREVAVRFASQFGNKDYGVTSVILQALFDVGIPRIVRKECFTPSPKIDSALCKLVPHNRYKIENFEDFKTLVHRSFAMRRKTLINNLKSYYEKEDILKVLKLLNLNENVRPEDISVNNYVDMYKILRHVKSISR